MQEQLHNKRHNLQIKIRKESHRKRFEDIRQRNMSAVETLDRQTQQQCYKLVDGLPDTFPSLFKVLINQNNRHLQKALCLKIDKLIDLIILGNSNWPNVMYILTQLIVSQKGHAKSVAKRSLSVCLNKYHQTQQFEQVFLKYLYVSIQILNKHDISTEEYEQLIDILSKWLHDGEHMEHLPLMFELTSDLLSLESTKQGKMEHEITRSNALIVECFVKHSGFLDQMSLLCLGMSQQTDSDFIESFLLLMTNLTSCIHPEHEKILPKEPFWYCLLIGIKSQRQAIVSHCLKSVNNLFLCRNINAVRYARQCSIIVNIVKMLKEVEDCSTQYVCDLIDCVSQYIKNVDPMEFTNDNILMDQDTITALLHAVKNNYLQYCELDTTWNALDGTRKYLVSLMKCHESCWKAVAQFKEYFEKLSESENEEIRQASQEIIDLLRENQDFQDYL